MKLCSLKTLTNYVGVSECFAQLLQDPKLNLFKDVRNFRNLEEATLKRQKVCLMPFKGLRKP